MKRFSLILFVGLILISKGADCQPDTINHYYFSNLREILSQDNNVKEVKLIQEKIATNKGFIQSMYVKYKDDPSDRYWHIGKEFIYNTSNNSLGFISNVDIKTKVLSDTSFSYFLDGTIAALYIYNLKCDSIISMKRGNSIWSGIFGKYYEKMPNIYKAIEYSCNRDTVFEKIFKYSESKGFVLDGEAICRDKQMKIIWNKHYEMGNEVGLVDENRKGIFTDNRDGQIYPTVQIGNQIWLAKNLAYKPDSGKFWVFNNDKMNVAQYGYLYNWETAKKVCPSGWHLPDKNDFEILLQYYDGNASKELIPSGSSGFSIIDCALRYGMNYTLPEGGTVFWTSTEKDKKNVWGFSVDSKNSIIRFYDTFGKKSGLPVRCIKDK